MKKIPGWLYVVVFFGILIAIKFIFLSKPEEKGGGPKGMDKSKMPVAVNYMIAQSNSFSNKVYSSGKIGALNEIEIKPEVSGKVTAIYFKEGDEVMKGTSLLKINDADLQAQLLKNKAQIKLAQDKLERLKKLLEVNGVSKEEYEIQDNEVTSLMADQAFINAQIAKTNITAPFSGRIGLKNISEGAYVSPALSIASLVQVKPLFIEFSLPEKYSNSLKKGLDVEFSRDNSNEKMKASIYAIEPKIDDVTKSIRCRAMYYGSAELYPGSFVKVYVDLIKTENSIMIPTQCVIPILKGQKVMIARNGEADEAKVVTGVRTDENIQILEGLQVGDTVLTTGLLSVKKGSKLKFLNQGKK